MSMSDLSPELVSIKVNSSRNIILLPPNHHPYGPDLGMSSYSLPLLEDDSFGAAVAVEVPPPLLKHPYMRMRVRYSNGMVCIGRDDKQNEFALWNPSSQKLKKIFEPPQPPPQWNQRVRFGFGYDSANDDYILLATVGLYEYITIEGYHVNVYSLKSNSWKFIKSSMPFKSGAIVYGDPVFLNNCFSWMMFDPYGNESIIVTLDLASETYRKLPNPFSVGHGGYRILSLFGGYLCMCNQFQSQAKHDVWIMKEFGVTESWTLLFSVEESVLPLQVPNSFITPLVFSKDGKMVLLQEGERGLFWFDLQKNSSKLVEIPGGHPAADSSLVATVCEGVGSHCLLLDGGPTSDDLMSQVLLLSLLMNIKI